MSDLGDLFTELLGMITRSAEGPSPKFQWQAVLVFCTLFGVVAGMFTTGLTSQCWFVIAGICGIAFLSITLLGSE